MTFDINKMLDPSIYDHPVKHVELIETHISWVLLTGEYAYKIKKPVDFGFLDFSTLEKRRRCCQQELRLNGRLAASVYLDVVPVTGSTDAPSISGEGDAIEYAVKMKQFPQSAQLDHKLEAGKLVIDQMDDVASMVADFHQLIESAAEDSSFGSAQTVHHPVKENFVQIREHLDTDSYEEDLKRLEEWSSEAFEKLSTTFEGRKHDGFVRECHGDMHLRNIVWLDDDEHHGPVAFDCIEFNDNLRWIDVISEVAFLVMDLQSRQLYPFAHRFLNSYLEQTGDYEGLVLLPYYLCYRALVRAKVSVLRLQQAGVSDDEKQQMLDEFELYFGLATDYSKTSTSVLMLMRGVSASGKSTVSQMLLENTGAIRVRSDVERKRLYDVPLDSSMDETRSDAINSGLYSARSSVETYNRLLSCAESIISAGYSVIIDAASLKYEQRHPFQQLAERLGVRFVILEVTAPVSVLKQRISARKNDVSDADIEVLEYQLESWQALSADELDHTVQIDTEGKIDLSSVLERLVLV